MNTFSYCGIPSDAFGCYYASNESERFYDRSDFQVYSDEPDWYNGGIYYGSTLKPKEFELNCYYEDISRKTKERMLAWLDRRTSGRLVFDHMPWKYYQVRPTKCLNGKEYTHSDGFGHDTYSGVFTIYFTAYEPWAYIDTVLYNTVNKTVSFFTGDNWEFEVRANIGVDEFAPTFTLSDDKVLYVLTDDEHVFSVNGNRELMLQKTGEQPEENSRDDYLYDPDLPTDFTTESRAFNLYNIGTEPTYPVIRIGGTAENGLTITNATNGSVCRVTTLPPAGSYLEIDCVHGVVYLIDGGNKTVEFSYHDLGFISLEPCGILDTDVTVKYTSGSNIIQLENRAYEESAVGKHLIIDGTLYRILNETDGGYIISGRPTTSGKTLASLFVMNMLSITGDAVALDKLEIEFTPRVQ